VYFSHLTDDPILIEESVCTSDNSGHVAAGSQDDANKLKCTPPAEEPPVRLDMDNLETNRDILCAKDLSETSLHKNDGSYRSVTSPRLRIVPLCAGPAEAQEKNPRSSREDTGDTIAVECGTSDRGSESSDDSDDEEYVEEPQRLTKRRRVRFSDIVRYTPYDHKKLRYLLPIRSTVKVKERQRAHPTRCLQAGRSQFVGYLH
jgi:hypothetical protein